MGTEPLKACEAFLSANRTMSHHTVPGERMKKSVFKA